MKKQRTLLLATVTIILLIFSVGCSKPTQENVNIFSQGLMFKNDEFGISMKIPDNWLQTKEDIDFFRESAKQQGFGNPKAQEGMLLLINKYPLKSRKSDNTLVTWFVQNMSMYPHVDNQAYALKIKEVVEKNSQLGIVATKGPYNEKVDGIDFLVSEYKSPSRGSYQKMYSAIINGYAHWVTLTYSTPEDLNTCNEIVKSITIRK